MGAIPRWLPRVLTVLAVSVSACSEKTDPYAGGSLAREYYPPLLLDDVQAHLLEAERNAPDRIRTLADQPCAITIWRIKEESAREFLGMAQEIVLSERSDMPDTFGDESFDEGWAITPDASILRAQISKCRDDSTSPTFDVLTEAMLDVGNPVTFRTSVSPMDTELGPGRRARIEILSGHRVYVLTWRYAMGG